MVKMIKNTSTKRKTTLVLAILALVCCTEAFLNRHLDYLLICGLFHTTLMETAGRYIHSAEWDNDVDDDISDVEAYELMLNTYFMAGKYRRNAPGSLIKVEYTPNKYRLLSSFYPSFLLKIFNLRNAWRIAAVVLWILACYSMYFLGTMLFGSRKLGTIAGLLTATSFMIIILIPGQKSELYQFATPVCLMALSVYLNHFSNEISRKSLLDSFILGCCAGICVFTGAGTLYFLPFLFFYGLLTMNWKAFITRNVLIILGIIIIQILYNPFYYRPAASTITSFVQFHRTNIHEFIKIFFLKYKVHMFYTVPVHLWVGALFGLFFLKARQLKFILCMFTTLLTSEFIHSLHAWRWAMTFSYYHHQILFPIYLLNARFLYFLLFENRLFGKSISAYFRKPVAILYVVLTLLTSNLGLLGNKYYYYESIRITPIEVLYRSFFTFDNYHIYKEMKNNR